MSLSKITPHEAKRLIEKAASSIDIRDADEHARERIAGARNVPLGSGVKLDGIGADRVSLPLRRGAPPPTPRRWLEPRQRRGLYPRRRDRSMEARRPSRGGGPQPSRSTSCARCRSPPEPRAAWRASRLLLRPEFYFSRASSAPASSSPESQAGAAWRGSLQSCPGTQGAATSSAVCNGEAVRSFPYRSPERFPLQFAAYDHFWGLLAHPRDMW